MECQTSEITSEAPDWFQAHHERWQTITEAGFNVAFLSAHRFATPTPFQPPKLIFSFSLTGVKLSRFVEKKTARGPRIKTVSKCFFTPINQSPECVSNSLLEQAE